MDSDDEEESEDTPKRFYTEAQLADIQSKFSRSLSASDCAPGTEDRGVERRPSKAVNQRCRSRDYF
jgi:hypothetical protein